MSNSAASNSKLPADREWKTARDPRTGD